MRYKLRTRQKRVVMNDRANELPYLLPPSGGWRGSTLDFAGRHEPCDYSEKYGERLQVARVFRGEGFSQLTEEELAWVKQGGILLYSISEHGPASHSRV